MNNIILAAALVSFCLPACLASRQHQPPHLTSPKQTTSAKLPVKTITLLLTRGKILRAIALLNQVRWHDTGLMPWSIQINTNRPPGGLPLSCDVIDNERWLLRVTGIRVDAKGRLIPSATARVVSFDRIDSLTGTVGLFPPDAPYIFTRMNTKTSVGAGDNH